MSKFAAAYQTDPTNYFVLLIITDGIITDFQVLSIYLYLSIYLSIYRIEGDERERDDRARMPEELRTVDRAWFGVF